jgi:phage terminase, small subunit, putative, P27 family
MPSGGHNRKPRQLKVIQGTFRKDRNPEHEPEPQKFVEVPRPPSWLNSHGKRRWWDLAEELVRNGLLTVVDIPALEMTCDIYGQYRDLHDAIYKPIDPDTGKRTKRTLAQYMAGRNSQTIPEYTAMRNLLAAYKSYLAEFGLTPVSRNRVNIPKPERAADPMEALLNEG